MKNKYHLMIGIALISISMILFIVIPMILPYCATHICGCTGQGEQWSFLQLVPIAVLLLGMAEMVSGFRNSEVA